MYAPGSNPVVPWRYQADMKEASEWKKIDTQKGCYVATVIAMQCESRVPRFGVFFLRKSLLYKSRGRVSRLSDGFLVRPLRGEIGPRTRSADAPFDGECVGVRRWSQLASQREKSRPEILARKFDGRILASALVYTYFLESEITTVKSISHAVPRISRTGKGCNPAGMRANRNRGTKRVSRRCPRPKWATC